MSNGDPLFPVRFTRDEFLAIASWLREQADRDEALAADAADYLNLNDPKAIEGVGVP